MRLVVGIFNIQIDKQRGHIADDKAVRSISEPVSTIAELGEGGSVMNN